MKALLFPVVVLFAVLSVTAQTNWFKLESGSKDFSISIPPGYQVLIDKGGYKIGRLISRNPFRTKTIELDDITRITAFTDGASFLVESYRTNKLEDALEEFYRTKFKPEDSQDLVLNSFQGKMAARAESTSYVLDVMVGSKDRIYRIYGLARSEKNEALKYFFSSIRLDGAAPFALASTLEDKIKTQALQISNLEETPFVVEKSGPEGDMAQPGKPLQVVRGVRPPPDDPGRIFIGYKPLPRYTESARKNGTAGTVTLRLTFGADGNIEKIVEINGLPHGLTEEAVKVARQIRFLPEEADGKPVTVRKTIQYAFTIY
jgi:TonB family protein